jgi:O-antigen/teichoic acid export membrane protein
MAISSASVKSQSEASQPTLSLRHRLIHGTKWAMVGSGIVQGLGLLSAIIIARFLGKEGFGQYGIVQSTIGMFGVFAGLAMGYTATKHVAEFRTIDPPRAGRFMGLTMLLGMISSGIVALIVLVFGKFVATHILNDASLLTALRWSVPLLIFNTLFDIQMAGLAGLEVFKLTAYVNVITGILTLPCATLGVWAYGVAGAIGGFVVARLIACVVLQVVLQQSCRQHGFSISYRGMRDDWIATWNFSFPSLLSNIIANPVNWICNVLLVNQPSGFAQMGIYQAAVQWQSAISFVPMRLMSVSLPIMSGLFGQRDYTRYYKVIKATQLAIAAIAVGVAIPIILLGKYIMSAYGKGFSEGYLILVLLLVAGIFVLMENSLSQVLLARGKAWGKAVVYFISSLLTLLLFWLVWVDKGVFGLAVSLCVAHFIGVMIFVVYLIALSRKDKHLVVTN